VNPALRVMTIIHSLLHTTLKYWSTMIGQYTYYSISYSSFHTFTYINKFCDEIIIYFFTLEKYRTLMIGPLWLCFLWGILHTVHFDKNHKHAFKHRHLRQNKIDKSTESMCKTRDVKGWDEKVTNRRGRAFTQKITPLSSSSPFGNPTLLLRCSIATATTLTTSMHG